MDQTRFEELKKKRFEEGLSDEEANELGQMFAEKKGEEYKTAEEFQAEAVADIGTRADGEEGAELAGEAPPDHSLGAEDRPESLKDEAESRAEPDSDEPAGRRAPIGSSVEEVDREET